MQIILFFATAVYALVKAVRSDDEGRASYRTVGFSGIIMAVFICLQMLLPLMPMYSLGGLFATCIIHTFVYKDKDVAYNRNMEAVNQKAYRDGLTGVKNKLAYLEALADIENCLADGSLTEYGVAVFDLNGLKQINDTLGHEAGDAYIKNGCMLICKQFDHSPVFRIGGDEFVAILRGGDYERREELVASFRKKVEYNRRNGLVVVASGMAIYQSENDESYNDVFKRADDLMYECKQALKAQ
jgi:diguanylate cyclase (GGDEF)-like protein